MKLLSILIAVAAIVLGGCAATLTPEQIVVAAGKIEITANKAVAEYKTLPRCGGPNVMPPLCSTQANADLADKVLDAAGVTIDSAEDVVRDPRFDGDAATAAAIAAGKAADAALEVISIIRR